MHEPTHLGHSHDLPRRALASRHPGEGSAGSTSPSRRLEEEIVHLVREAGDAGADVVGLFLELSSRTGADPSAAAVAGRALRRAGLIALRLVASENRHRVFIA